MERQHSAHLLGSIRCRSVSSSRLKLHVPEGAYDSGVSSNEYVYAVAWHWDIDVDADADVDHEPTIDSFLQIGRFSAAAHPSVNVQIHSWSFPQQISSRPRVIICGQVKADTFVAGHIANHGRDLATMGPAPNVVVVGELEARQVIAGHVARDTKAEDRLVRIDNGSATDFSDGCNCSESQS